VVRHLDRLIDKLRCDEAVKAVLKRAVDWEKEARFEDAGTFCEALRDAAAPVSSREIAPVPVDISSNEISFSHDGHQSRISVITSLLATCNAVSFSHHSDLLVSGYGDGSIRLWHGVNAPGQRAIVVSKFKAHAGAVTSLALSPGGPILASGSVDASVRLWSIGGDLRKGVAPRGPKLILRGHVDVVWSVAFSPDGATLASGSGDKTICLWDVASGAAMGVPKRHEGPVRCVAWNPDGSILASDFADETLELWNIEKGVVQHFQKFTSSGWGVAFNPYGTHLVTGFREYTIMILDLEEGIGVFAAQPRHERLVQSVAWSPDGRTLASGSRDTTVRLWSRLLGSWETLAEKLVLEGHTGAVTSVAFSPDSATLASASEDGTVRLWDVATGACRAVLT
jgi:WD40 repeat protein